MNRTNLFIDMNRRTPVVLSVLLLGLATVLPAHSAQPKPLSEEIATFLGTAKPRRGPGNAPARPADDEGIRSWKAGDGYLTYAGTPAGHHFAAETTPARGAGAEEQARKFLKTHGRPFGVTSASVDFSPFKKRERPGRTSVRLQQTYQGLPIVAAEVSVQVNEEGGIEFVLSHIARDTSPLDEGRVSLRPSFASAEAANRLREHLTSKEGAQELNIEPGELKVFAPAVLDAPGPIRLVWELEAIGAGAETEIHERVLVDAHTGEVVRRMTLSHSALNRQVYDANSTTSDPGTLARAEGQPASTIIAADNAYLFLGDSYQFYLDQHGRDSLDGSGLTLNATVRLCSSTQCPWPNATYNPSDKRLRFGMGFVVDDFVAHEFTHGVTAHESNLMYENDAGAINEALSDIWGEFVDLSNGRGNDTASARWRLGEDQGSASRNMRNPPSLGDPDRLGSRLYVPPTNDPTGGLTGNDFGGVHTNSGIINKLCYLLTDGDAFNGFTIQGMGIPRVADLFYEANVTILLSGSNYQDLFNALRQAAVNLGWTSVERRNLLNACVAVELGGVYVDWANTCSSPNGIRRCRSHGNAGPYRRISDGVNAVVAGEYLGVVGGSYNERLTIAKAMTIRAPDGAVTIGQ